jgi:hypothetical protein
MWSQQMRDGLYKVEFQTPLGVGAGVIHLVGGKIWGGDAGLYYVGTYALSGSEFTAEVATDRHTHYAGIVSVFGKDRVRISLKGTTSGDSGQVVGTAAESPGVTFQAKFSRIAD